jgi:hypothetical protein
MGVEYYCKKLAGRPPVYTDDKSFDPKSPRKVGLLVYDLPQYGNMGDYAKSLLQQTCGVTPTKVVTYDLTGSGSGTEGLASDMVQLRAAGVTTVFYLGDLLSAGIFSQAASSNNYFPEWFLPGFGGVDTGHIARDYSGDEWAHAFGFSYYHTFPLYAAEMWWDPNATGSDGQAGSYRYLNNGARHTFGGWPAGDDPGLFRSGVSMAPGS